MNDTQAYIEEVLTDMREGCIGPKSALVRLRMRAGWSPQKVMRVTGASRQTVKHWLSPSGDLVPTVEDVKRFADAFGSEVAIAHEDNASAAPSM